MKIDKRNNFENDVIIIDGLWGSGKSLLCPIISGMDKMIKTTMASYIDQINILIKEAYIDKSIGNAFITNEIDRLIYENHIGRNLNYRLYDDSGLFNNPNMLKDINRLFKKDVNIDDNDFKNSAISILTHMLLITNDSILQRNDHNIKIIEVVRNPIFAFDHWFNFLNRFNGKKIFQLGYYHDTKKVPWFAGSWAEKFNSLNDYDKTLSSMIFCYNTIFSKYKKLSKDPSILFLSFESIVYDTDEILNKIAVFTERKHSRRLNKILKKQKVPRQNILNGTGYSKYGFNSDKKHIPDEQFKIDHFEKLKINCSNELLEEYKNLIDNYNLNFK